jgi:hypothetical protein
VRGVVLNLWNDNPAYSTEAQDAPFIRPGLRVLAQKGWGSPGPAPDYATFAALAARAAGTP